MDEVKIMRGEGEPVRTLSARPRNANDGKSTFDLSHQLASKGFPASLPVASWDLRRCL
jgi:hypothetical protein